MVGKIRPWLGIALWPSRWGSPEAKLGLHPQLEKPMAEKMVTLARLDSAHGFSNITDVLDIVGQLQEKGINAICEQAPSALMDSPDNYLLKVPESQYLKASEEIAIILAR